MEHNQNEMSFLIKCYLFYTCWVVVDADLNFAAEDPESKMELSFREKVNN